MLNTMCPIARYITQFSRKEIIALLKNAQFLYRAFGLTLKKASTENSVGKILIITPKKTGSAPQRNRLRRRIKALFYQKKYYNLGYNFIVYCSRESALLDYQTLSSTFHQAFSTLIKQ